MEAIEAFENERGMIASTLHRFVVATYATIMIGFGSPSGFSLSLVSAVIGYVFLYLIINKGYIWHRLARIVVDFVFVVLGLYLYGKADIVSFVFVLLPLFCNALLQNGSVNYLYYVTTPIIVYVMLGKQPVMWLVFVFLFLFVLDIIGVLKHEVMKASSDLDEIIDNFFVSEKGMSKSYLIYKSAIPMLNKFPTLAALDSIYCFRFVKDKITLVNGSRFVFKYQFYNIDEIKAMVRNGVERVKNVKIELDGKLYICEEGFVIKVAGEIYLYLLKHKDNYIKNEENSRFLFPRFFARMANVVESERKRKLIEDEEQRNMAVKIGYVDSAMDTMHFIRNKLSPLKTYIDMKDDYNKGDDNLKQRIVPYMDETFRQLVSSYNMIVRRANTMLEESKNPLVYTQTKPYGIQQLFSELKSQWVSYGLDEALITINLLPKEHGERRSVFFNADGMFLIIDNWISNMIKHGSGLNGLEIKETPTSYSIIFTNSIKKSKNLDFVKHFAADNRNEIVKRRWHGLQTMKEILSQMDIQGVMLHDNNSLLFRIDLAKTISYEENIGD